MASVDGRSINIAVIKLLVIVVACVLPLSTTYADAGHETNRPLPGLSEAARGEAAKSATEGNVERDDSDHREGFPTFHPLVVHFPIVFLIVAFPFYSLGVLRRHPALKKSGVVMASLGLLGALLGADVFHPHTIGLDPEATAVLSNHDLFAHVTLYLSAIATVVGALTCARRFQRLELQAATMLFLLLALVSVSLTGHYGAKLVHIYGVGPGGKFLETEHVGVHLPILSKRHR